jgi:hypothetical protein
MLLKWVEVVRASETSFYFNEAIRRYVAEDCSLHTRRRNKVKSHAMAQI